jgi:hypothetical protein
LVISKKSIAILSLCAPALWLFGCAGTVPKRALPMDSLVRSGELDLATATDRNDDRLGLGRTQLTRTVIRATAASFDRQRVIDGRPFNDYRLSTRTVESLRP